MSPADATLLNNLGSVLRAAGRSDEAVGAYLDGSYDRALEELETLRPGVLESGQRGEQELLLTNLVYLYVAFDRPNQACETFGELRTLDPQVQFDEDLVSPKIRRLVERCPN